ncbi:two-component system, chemotaxis family, response regulator CheB [Hydrocarboniphaga daqingensis]|uniref:Protein-glutamate methylesterase/protein-glutamine glutaminase n=1 Tax=Hydrocarboniphaga daqingensis TaxID=490188 RepID=A0A1M5K6M0_9GAMM|nr:chemotaxis response regulator protein-glutamate methylesterase [Hydrocarboniphaga daqingensis]SHG48220.1 two-component system, chemotaxis family, response regulator CheB [Hydrocarboniphaga daqingensis]
MAKIGVFVIDDSAVVRQVVSEVLTADPGIELIGSAMDPLFALDKMAQRWPDVIVLDIEMPRMDGLTFLRKIMAERPTPVVICSSLTEKGAETTIEALAAGAIGIVCKPGIGVRRFLMQDAAVELVQAVKAASHARMRRITPAHAVAPKLSADAVLSPPSSGALTQTTERLVAIGTSTGGTQALEQVLTALPRTSPGIVVVQHMPEKFTASFAARLNGLCQIEVREAVNRDRVMPGRALIAPGGQHLLVRRSGAQYYVEVVDGPLVSRHRPSVDVLFRSVAKQAGRNAMGIIMTGMGDDGAHGLKEMRDAGATTLAQDEASCIVYGMPREAVKLDAVDRVVSLRSVASEIARFG